MSEANELIAGYEYAKAVDLDAGDRQSVAQLVAGADVVVRYSLFRTRHVISAHIFHLKLTPRPDAPNCGRIVH